MPAGSGYRSEALALFIYGKLWRIGYTETPEHEILSIRSCVDYILFRSGGSLARQSLCCDSRGGGNMDGNVGSKVSAQRVWPGIAGTSGKMDASDRPQASPVNISTGQVRSQ
jgi:hypothetical protein